MEPIVQQFAVRFEYPVHFTTDVFAPENPVLRNTLQGAGKGPHKALVVVDDGLLEKGSPVLEQIEAFAEQHSDVFTLVRSPLVVHGGEAVKNCSTYYKTIQAAIHQFGICRQSFVIAVGGGAVLDMAGYAAATAHRGVRLIRVPTTVLAQDDSAVGVKNSVNAFGKKNFIGTFAPPYAVINDFAFLTLLSHRDWMAGTSEAVKVALLKDPVFFSFLEANAEALVARDMEAMRHLIYRCAELHVRHIGMAGDPFENGSSRPLDLGHWAAHKLEQFTNFELRHGEAVAIGLALDATYSYQSGLLLRRDWSRILSLLSRLGFALYIPELSTRLGPREDPESLFHGLVEFREHLGGQLTVMLLHGIGRPTEVHEMDEQTLISSVRVLQEATWRAQLSSAV